MSATKPKGVTGVAAPSGFIQQREQNPSLRWPFDVGTAVEPGAYERMARTDPTVASCVMAVVLPIVQAEWAICAPEAPVKLKDPNADPEDDAEEADPAEEPDGEEVPAEDPPDAGTEDTDKDPGTDAPAGAEDMADGEAAGESEPGPDEEEAVDPITAFVRQAFLEDLRPGLQKVLADIVRSAIVNGHHVVEPIYRLLEDGEFAGKVTLRTLAPRPAWTIERFNLDDAGELEGIVQAAPTPEGPWARVDLAIEEILVFTYDQQGGDPRGQSMLRPIFLTQKVKELLLKLIGVRNEREALGMPIAEEPEQGLTTPDRARLKATLKGWRAHEEGYLLVPHGVKVTLPEGKAGASSAIRDDFGALNLEIRTAFLQHFQALGSTETGARSVGEIQAAVFYLALVGIAELVSNELNTLIERLVDLNFGPQESYPYFEAPKIRAEDVTDALAPIALALEKGVITHDDGVEAHGRELLGLPKAPPKPKLHPAMQAVADAAKAGQIAPPVAPAVPPAAAAAPAIAQAAAAAAAMHEHPRQGELFLGGFTPRRMLSSSEKRVAFGEIAARLDAAGPELQQRVGNAIRGNRAELVGWLRPLARRLAAGDQSALVDLARKDLPRAVRAEIVAAVSSYADDLHRFGRAQAERERKLSPSVARRAARAAAEALREEIPAAVPEAPAAVAMQDHAPAPVRAEASIAADRIADELLRVLRLTTTRAAEQKRRLPEILDEVERQIDASSEAMSVVRDAAIATSVKAVSGGREEVFGEHEDEIASVTYSAVMDSNTCGVCEAADEQEAASLDEADASLPATPNPECEGGADRCRCMWVVDYL